MRDIQKNKKQTLFWCLRFPQIGTVHKSFDMAGMQNKNIKCRGINWTHQLGKDTKVNFSRVPMLFRNKSSAFARLCMNNSSSFSFHTLGTFISSHVTFISTSSLTLICTYVQSCIVYIYLQYILFI